MHVQRIEQLVDFLVTEVAQGLRHHKVGLVALALQVEPGELSVLDRSDAVVIGVQLYVELAVPLAERLRKLGAPLTGLLVRVY